MIDDPQKQLKYWPLSKREETIQTLEALWKVARAAQAFQNLGYCTPALKDALAALTQLKGGSEDKSPIAQKEQKGFINPSPPYNSGEGW